MTQSVIVQESNGVTVTMTASSDETSPTLVSQRVKRQIDSGGSPPYGMTYTPYDSSGGCMSAGTILSDLQTIQGKGFSRIRMYGVDCDQLSTVADQATSLGFKITLGVYIDSTGLTRGNADLAAVIAWGNWANVDIITIGTTLAFWNLNNKIGNEAVTNGWVTGGELVGFINSARSQLRAAGYNGIVSTAETVGAYENNPEICGAVDSYVHANIHPYFNPNCDSSGAGAFVVSQQNLVESICNIPCIISETGWPTGGGNDGAAVASPQDQVTAVGGIYQATGGAATFFSYRDDPWKAAGVEQHWGIYSSLISMC